LFFLMPMLPILAVYVLAAVLPAAILLCYVYKHDTVEKEPPGLLIRLLFMGVLAALAATVLETIFQTVLDLLVDPGSPVYTILLAFLVVSMVEEGVKFRLLKRTTWNDPAFNYRFDGIVYAVFTSLGFAAYENITYVLHYGMSVALPRALLAIPGHMSFAVIMGIFYGRARACRGRGELRGMTWNLRASYVCAVVLHGIYDTCAMIGTGSSTAVFLLFVAAMFFAVFRLIKKESATDMPV
jgi:RsiW-degrading membrane proteinase PrsW (M82 family)